MFNKPNSASRNFILAAALWLVLGVLMGLTLALKFVFPDLFSGIPWLVFSRLHQAHVNTVAFAFLSGGMMGLWLYIVPKLTGRQLWSERLGNLCVLLWNLAIAYGVVGLLNAQTQSREYAELIWSVDVAVQMQVIAKTKPGQQWVVARALRKIALELLQKEVIRVALPRQRIETMS